MTRSEFADFMGVNASQVTRWGAKGWLVLTPTGTIDPEASKASVEANRNPHHGGRRTKTEAPEGSGLDLARSKASTEWLKLHRFADAYAARLRELISSADAGQAYARVLAVLEQVSAKLEVDALQACVDLRGESALRTALAEQCRAGLSRMADLVAGIEAADAARSEIDALLDQASESQLNATKAVRAELERREARMQLDVSRGQLREHADARVALRAAATVYRTAMEKLPRTLAPQWISAAVDRPRTLHAELRRPVVEIRRALQDALQGPLPLALLGPVPAPVHALLATAARALRPRPDRLITEFAEAEQIIIPMGPATGPFRADLNPFIAEPLDWLSAHFDVTDVVMCFPVQYGKSTAGLLLLTYYMRHAPTPIFVCLPDEATREKWADHKWDKHLKGNPLLLDVLDSTGARDGANQKFFKSFGGGVLQVEFATSGRLKLATAQVMLIDEYDEVDQQLSKPRASGDDGSAAPDDPEAMLVDRTTAYGDSAKRLWISSPGMKDGRMWKKYESGTQHQVHVKCPHCGHPQVLETTQLKHIGSPAEDDDTLVVWYECIANGCRIYEGDKPRLFAPGNWAWVPTRPKALVKSYQLGSLYFPLGIGISWVAYKRQQLAAEASPNEGAKKTFRNSREALPYEPPNVKKVAHGTLADRAEPYPLRTAPMPVCVLTAGIDTQDDRLELHIIGWGAGRRWWVVDYCKLPGDPNHDQVWEQLDELLDKPIEHESGALLKISALAIDTGGHRGEAVKHWVRNNQHRRALAIFGSKNPKARTLGTPQKVDLNWRGRLEKKGAELYSVGVSGIKRHLFGQLASDEGKAVADRLAHFSDELTDAYYKSLVSEVEDPRRGWVPIYRRNEALDTWVYAYAATEHPKLRLQTWATVAWNRKHAEILDSAPPPAVDQPAPQPLPPPPAPAPAPAPVVRRPVPARRPGGFSPTSW